jgi:hypothetical protein
MTHYSGEGNQSCDDSFEKWLEQFEERAKLVGWSEDHRRYHLALHLDGSAYMRLGLVIVPLLMCLKSVLSLWTSRNFEVWSSTDWFKTNCP